MPRYRLREFHKHYHIGVRYSGRPAHRANLKLKPGEDPDVIELDEERAERIMNKLIPLDKAPSVEEIEQPKVESEEEAPYTVKEEVSAVTSTETEQAPADPAPAENEAPASESKEPEKSEDELSPLSAVHRGAGNWDVMQGDKKMNDSPLTEAQAKALVDGSVKSDGVE